jgi:hypothetical protein
MAEHGANQPFEPALYSTRVGFVVGVVALIAAQIVLAPLVFLNNAATGSHQNAAGFTFGTFVLMAIAFPILSRSTHNFLAQRGETRTVAYGLVGGAFFLVGGALFGGLLHSLATGTSGAAAMGAYRVFNLETAQ